MAALHQLQDPAEVAARRGITIKQVSRDEEALSRARTGHQAPVAGPSHLP